MKNKNILGPVGLKYPGTDMVILVETNYTYCGNSNAVVRIFTTLSRLENLSKETGKCGFPTVGEVLDYAVGILVLNASPAKPVGCFARRLQEVQARSARHGRVAHKAARKTF